MWFTLSLALSLSRNEILLLLKQKVHERELTPRLALSPQRGRKPDRGRQACNTLSLYICFDVSLPKHMYLRPSPIRMERGLTGG
jgi:hypothetical protein